MRRLLIIRHAIAQQRDAQRWPDDDKRPLSSAGKKRFVRAARSLRTLVGKPDAVFSSPLKRARQTARILRREAKFPKARKLKTLRPEASVQETLTALRKVNSNYVAIVGHEPCLSALASELLVGSKALHGCFKKGGFALLQFGGRIAAAKGRLDVYAPPRLLIRR